MIKKLGVTNISISIAFLFHFCGAIGILFSPYAQWFINATNINLIVSFLLIVITQLHLNKNEEGVTIKSFNKNFLLFVLIAFLVGFIAEVVGVNTNLLFGNYEYKNILGYKLFNVPIMIGLQWFVTVYCCSVMMSFVNQWAAKKLKEMGEEVKEKDRSRVSLFYIIDAAFLATAFDYILEPAAIKLNFWQWQNNEIPNLNYASWFLISGLLVIVFGKLKFNKLNTFAIHLFIMQLLFFVAIRLYY